VKRFLIDEDLPRSLAAALEAAGMEAVHVVDAGLRGSPDAAVFEEAVRAGRSLITADLDFANVLRFPPGGHEGIVVVRYPNETTVAALNFAIVASLASVSEDELHGAVVVLEPGRVRIRGR
jgi:predicted nuclease of predicted toxin-antitoxin system